MKNIALRMNDDKELSDIDDEEDKDSLEIITVLHIALRSGN